jgi:hypothetical protein
MEQLSYNLSEEAIGKYFELEERKEADEANYDDYAYQKKLFLAGLSEKEIHIFKKLRNDYFIVQKIVLKLENES